MRGAWFIFSPKSNPKTLKNKLYMINFQTYGSIRPRIGLILRNYLLKAIFFPLSFFTVSLNRKLVYRLSASVCVNGSSLRKINKCESSPLIDFPLPDLPLFLTSFFFLLSFLSFLCWVPCVRGVCVC